MSYIMYIMRNGDGWQLQEGSWQTKEGVLQAVARSINMSPHGKDAKYKVYNTNTDEVEFNNDQLMQMASERGPGGKVIERTFKTGEYLRYVGKGDLRGVAFRLSGSDAPLNLSVCFRNDDPEAIMVLKRSDFEPYVRSPGDIYTWRGKGNPQCDVELRALRQTLTGGTECWSAVETRGARGSGTRLVVGLKLRPLAEEKIWLPLLGEVPRKKDWTKTIPERPKRRAGWPKSIPKPDEERWDEI